MRIRLKRWTNDGDFEIENGKIHVHSNMSIIQNESPEGIRIEEGFEIIQVDGNLDILKCRFTTMRGFPRVMDGNLSIIDCPKRIPQADILQYSPDEINGRITLMNSPLVDVKSIVRSCKCDVKKIYVDQ